MAFNIDLTENGATGTPGDIPVSGLNKKFRIDKTVDFSDSDNFLAQTEVAALMTIPAYVHIKEVMILVHTADADVSDVDLGPYTTAGVAVDADGFVDGATLAATGLVRDVGTAAYNQQSGTDGYMGTSDWVLGILNNDADTLNGAIVTFMAVGYDLRNSLT